jgi:glycerophosphoryl diester phosphodiesterase
MNPPDKPIQRRAQRLLIIGHRGASGDAPENTMAAFELALEQGADGIEFDVHLSRDGVPVVIHDARVNRTTSGTGRVRHYTAAALAKLDAGSWFNRRYPARARPRYAACRIPRLEEVLEWVRARRCRAWLEIKQPRLRYRGIEAKVLEQIYRAGAERHTTIISFHLPTLRRLRRLDAKIELGIDFTRPVLAVLLAKTISAGTVLPHGRFAKRRWIARIHDAGLRVIAWGLDDPVLMRCAISSGVDGIITSFPTLLREIPGGLNSLPPCSGCTPLDIIEAG